MIRNSVDISNPYTKNNHYAELYGIVHNINIGT